MHAERCISDHDTHVSVTNRFYYTQLVWWVLESIKVLSTADFSGGDNCGYCLWTKVHK